MIPTAQDRAPKNGQEPVTVGSGGASSHDSATANATNTLPKEETGGRMAHANQQVEPGMQPKQTSASAFQARTLRIDADHVDMSSRGPGAFIGGRRRW